MVALTARRASGRDDQATRNTGKALRDNIDSASTDRVGQVALSFEVLLVKDLGAKFGQRRNFIAELEAAVPLFYEQVGQHIRSWQASAPKLREEKADPELVSPEALRESAEEEAAD